jgi:plastocyanin
MKKFTYAVFTMTLLVGMVFNTSLFAVTHNVQVGNYYFSPSSLNVEVGDIVKWVWVQGSHTTTSSSIPAGAPSWDEPINSGNQTYSYTVTTAGTYDYVCTPHAGMGMVGSFIATVPANTLTVTPSNQNVNATAGSTSFTVLSNTTWNASSNQTWCTVTTSGSGNGTLVANYNENTTTSSRTATISVSISGLPPITVQVIQDGSIVGIPESNVNSIRLFPNPAKDVVKISLDNSSDNTRVSLVDLTGKIIFDRSVPKNNEITLNVGDLPRGYYFIKIFLNNETITRRVILAD